MRKCSLLLACALTLIASSAGAQTVSGSLDMANRYLWRGVEQTDGIWFVPTVTAGRGWLSGAVSADVTATSQQVVLDNANVTLGSSVEWRALAIEGGVTGYYAMASLERGSSHELFVVVSRAGLLTPSLEVYHDVQAGDGTYMRLGAEQPVPLPLPLRRVALAATAGIAYNRHQWTDRVGWNDASLGVRAGWQARRLDVSPYVLYSRSLAGRVVPSRVLFGVGIATRTSA